ncbi:BQ2448_769 [Microbotryum intermedium]|uniref:Maintenance of mitochondrial morphology protein 1 n=1 Tax=Microbotryum intermedium TaxID=269621 RepID=A0A238FBX9_9BASI|nr:BQ2448_769 [Microbotryum intermedium]
MADPIPTPSTAASSTPSPSRSSSIGDDPSPLSASTLAPPSPPAPAWRAIECNCPPIPRWTFTQGFLLGQFSILLLVGLFLKYIVFEHRPPSPPPRSTTSRAKRRTATATSATSSTPSSSASASASTSQILSSLDYDLSSHAPESLDWLNVLLGQTLSAYRGLIFSSSPQGPKGLFESILNRKSSDAEERRLVSVDYISVDDVQLGQAYPFLGDARVRPSGAEGGAVRVEFDVDYLDQVSLSISTSVLFNFPRPSFAVLPVSLGITLERFSGTLTVELPSPTSNHPNPSLHLSLHPDFELHLSTTSLLGAQAKLHDVPKIEQLVRERLRSFIVDKVVWPGRVSIALPAPIVPPSMEDAASTSSSSAWGEANDFENGPDDFPSTISSNPFLSDQEDLSQDEQDDEHMLKSERSPSERRSFPGAPVVDLENPEGPLVLLQPRLDRKTSRLSTANNSPTKKKSTTAITTTTTTATTAETTSPTRRNNLYPSNGLSLGASRGSGAGPGSGAALPSPSPTESLPGYFGSSNANGIRQRGHPSTASALFVGNRNRNSSTSVLERR